MSSTSASGLTGEPRRAPPAPAPPSAPLGPSGSGQPSEPSEPPAATAAVEARLRELAAAGKRDEAAELLIHEYSDAVLTRALRLVRDRQLAREILQQTMFQAHRDLAKFDGRASFKTWLLAIANHRALDLLRRQRRHQKRAAPAEALARLVDPAAPDAAAGVDLPRLLAALEECLQQLSPEARATVLARFQEELSYEEMARTSGDRAGTLHARVTRALPILRRCMEEKGMQP